MKDDLTEKQKYDNWVVALNKLHEKGWRCMKRWLFLSRSGTKHDLSCANLDKLDLIEKQGYFLV